MKLENINGYLISNLNFKEMNNEDNNDKKIIATGLLLPKNEISRNGVKYDWDSVKQTYNQVKGLKLMYNHELEGLDAIPIGHCTKVWLKEEDDDDGIAGLYYEADLDPNHPQTRKILRGDLDSVSLQINASEVTPEYDNEYGEYQLAKISDWLEFSVVPVQGMKDASIEIKIAEALKMKKLKEDYSQEFIQGFEIEKKEHPELSNDVIKQLVIDHLKQDNTYYNKNNKEEDINTATAAGAMAPAKIKDDNSDMEDGDMKKKEQDDSKVDTQTDVQTDEDKDKDIVLQEEYNNDMTKIVETLDLLKKDNDSLRKELDDIKKQISSDSSEIKKESDDEDIEIKDKDIDKDAEIKDKNVDEDTKIEADEDIKDKDVDEDMKTEADEDTKDEDTEDEDTEIKKEADEDISADEETDNEDEEEDEDEEPIPPKLEKKSKLNKGLKELRKHSDLTMQEALKGYVKERLRI